MRGEGGEVAGSQPMSTALHAHGVQRNFGDLTPYLTYNIMKCTVVQNAVRKSNYS